MSRHHANPISEADLVEVVNCGDGIKHSYYGSRFISPVHRGRYTIRYTHLMREDDENVPLEEEVRMATLRPFPEAIPQWDFRLGEIVNGWINDDWWLGRVVGKENGQYMVCYEDDTHVTHSFENVRFHQEWSRGVWLFTKLSRDL